MTYFPHNPHTRPTPLPASPLSAMRQRLTRDILWNQPVFKAPVLPSPRVALDPLPFTATRLTLPARQG